MSRDETTSELLHRLAHERSTKAATDRAHHALHVAPDDQIERMEAACTVCDVVTPGTWQHSAGGRRVRTPTEHPAPGRRTACPGAFQLARLIQPEGNTK